MAKPWAIAASVIGFITLGMYLAVILGQGDNTFWEVAPWATLMFLAALGALTAALTESRNVALGGLITATVIYAVLGFLTLLSIGGLFVVAAVLTAVALVRAYRTEPESVI